MKHSNILSSLEMPYQAKFLLELVHTFKLQVPKKLGSSNSTYLHTNQYKKSHSEYETLNYDLGVIYSSMKTIANIIY